jgi:hypothetical protein
MPQLDLYRGLGQVFLLICFFCLYFFSAKFFILPRFFRKYKFWAKRKILFASNVAQLKLLATALTKTQERFYLNNLVSVLAFFTK